MNGFQQFDGTYDCSCRRRSSLLHIYFIHPLESHVTVVGPRRYRVESGEFLSLTADCKHQKLVNVVQEKVIVEVFL